MFYEKGYYHFERMHSETICADRRLPGTMDLVYKRYAAAFECMFDPDYPDRDAARYLAEHSIPEDTAKADYVWLPIRFDGERPCILRHDEWSLDEFE